MKLANQLGGQVRRQFIRVQGRGVHYFRAGAGPPLVLLHAAMASALAHLPLMQRLMTDHTVFAFDHPGYGDSDPLRGRQIRIANAADALKDTLVALKIPACPVFGSHTGGSVAIEVALRHPAYVSAVVVDGVPMFREHEAEFFLSADYMPPFKIDDDGSHLFAAWVKTRDTALWFPWNKRTARNRRQTPFPALKALNVRFLDRLRAGTGYEALYRAAFMHNAHEAVSNLTVPATFMAHSYDPLFCHLKRLPRPKTGQRIIRFSGESVDYTGEIARVLRGYRINSEPPPEPPFRPSPDAINRRYIDFAGGQILVRSSAETRSRKPLLLLHEGRASSRIFEPLMKELAQYRPIYSLDLPDNGASDAWTILRPQVRHYAAAAFHTLESLSITGCDIYAVGASAAIALDLLERAQFSTARVVLETPDFYDPAFARRLLRYWSPALEPQWDGAHLNHVWLMLRDELAAWPWFDKHGTQGSGANTTHAWSELNARVTDILRSLPTYHRLTMAALRYEWREPLRRASRRAHPVTLASQENDPRLRYTHAAARLSHLQSVATIPTAPAEKARELLRLLTRHR